MVLHVQFGVGTCSTSALIFTKESVYTTRKYRYFLPIFTLPSILNTKYALPSRPCTLIVFNQILEPNRKLFKIDIFTPKTYVGTSKFVYSTYELVYRPRKPFFYHVFVLTSVFLPQRYNAVVKYHL